MSLKQDAKLCILGFILAYSVCGLCADSAPIATIKPGDYSFPIEPNGKIVTVVNLGTPTHFIIENTRGEISWELTDSDLATFEVTASKGEGPVMVKINVPKQGKIDVAAEYPDDANLDLDDLSIGEPFREDLVATSANTLPFYFETDLLDSPKHSFSASAQRGFPRLNFKFSIPRSMWTCFERKVHKCHESFYR